jgi:NAD(P)-dependent dehydrogenase (short-subunit alcohol dehydrogenase family)
VSETPTALVTGAAGTVGAAVAAGLSGAGYPLGLTDIDEAGLEAVRSAVPGPAVAVVADATAPGEAARVVAEVGEGLGPVGVLVNAIGTFGPRSAFVEADEVAWWRVMEVNVRAPAAFLRAALPAMVAAGRGHVVNLASRTAVWDDPAGPSSGYATSKAALVRMGQAVAAEVAGTGVVVIGLSPGLVRSAMTAGRPGYRSMDDSEFVPVDRSVAHVLALLSGDHDHLHGHLVHALDDLDELGAWVTTDPSRRRLGLGPVGAEDPFA